MARKAASPSLTLRITDDQRQRAIESNSGGCLVADAIKSQYPEYTKVTVDMATIRFSDAAKGVRYTYLTPPAAQHFLLAFDQGWPTTGGEVYLKRAVKITTMIEKSRQPARLRARQERLAALEAKAAAGTLTKNERGALTKLRENRPPGRPSTYGEPEVVLHRGGGVTVVGGVPPRMGPAHPNLLRGRDRHFGAKLADPGSAFREAVDAAVAERLAQQ